MTHAASLGALLVLALTAGPALADSHFRGETLVISSGYAHHGGYSDYRHHGGYDRGQSHRRWDRYHDPRHHYVRRYAYRAAPRYRVYLSTPRGYGYYGSSPGFVSGRYCPH